MHTNMTPPVEGRSTTHRSGFMQTSDPDLAATIETVCQKGGCGKSTLTAAVAHEIARLGGKVLLIDADPNAGLTLSQLGLDIPMSSRDEVPTLADLLIDPSPGSAERGIIDAPLEWQPDTTIPWSEGGALQPGGYLGVIPGSNDLSATIARISSEPAFERRLRRILSGVARKFDVVMIDCGPQNDAVSWVTNHASGAALIAAMPSDSVVVGVEAQLALVVEHVNAWGEDLPLRIGGIVPLRHDGRLSAHRKELGRLISLGQIAADPTRPAFTPIDMPAPVGEGARPWTAGTAVTPEIIKSAGYYEQIANARLPISWGLRPDEAEASWKYRVTYPTTYARVLPFTRLALRTLQMVDAPVLASIEQALDTNPIANLWGPATGVLTTDDITAENPTATSKTTTKETKA